MTSYSCYWHNVTHGREVEHHPLPGACRPFSAPALRRLLQCRDIIFVGDSMAVQFWQTVTCLLHDRDTQYSLKWLKTWHDQLCPFGANHCRLVGGCASYPNSSSRSCFFQDKSLKRRLQWFIESGVRNDSILVMNTGLHYLEKKPY
eukprot:EG_transcript_31465